jgi:hypothetical protein
MAAYVSLDPINNRSQYTYSQFQSNLLLSGHPGNKKIVAAKDSRLGHLGNVLKRDKNRVAAYR